MSPEKIILSLFFRSRYFDAIFFFYLSKRKSCLSSKWFLKLRQHIILTEFYELDITIGITKCPISKVSQVKMSNINKLVIYIVN